MKKRIFAVLLAVLILGSALTPAVFAEDGYIITYDPREIEGGSLDMTLNWVRIPKGQPIGEMPVPTNSKPNMVFAGWFDEENKEYTAETVLTADVVVHAYWMEKQMTMPFTDITGHWAYDGIKYCYENGLMNGMTPTTFEPELTTTRAMVVTVLYRMEKEPPVGGLNNPFKDVKFTDWYGSAIVWAASEGIVNGMKPDAFDPNGNITREQLAAILYRYANYCKYTTDIQYVLNDFKDKNSVSAYAVEPMQWAYAADLITGMKEGNDFYLKPGANATRAQIATILMRFMENVIPHETKVGFDNLEMTLPASWYKEYNYEAALSEDETFSYCIFRCRREQDAGMGGVLFTVELRKPPVPEYPMAYEVVGTLSKGSESYNVILVYPSDVEFGKYADLYTAMKAEKDNIVKTFTGYNGWTFSAATVPTETKVSFDNLEMTLPVSWYDEYTYEAALSEDESYSYCTFRCRREEEAGMGGILFTVELRKAPVPEYLSAYEVVGALSKDSESYNVIIVYPGDVECGEFAELYNAMKAEKDNIVKTFTGCNGWHFAFG